MGANRLMRDGMIREIHRRDSRLSVAGWILMAALVVALIVAPFDHRTILGINPWIKPIKFYFASAIFLWTMAWFQGDLTGRKTWFSFGFPAAMAIENFLITMQAARGTPSHFNHATSFDGAVFATMGAVIVANTLLLFWMLVLFFRRPAQRPASYLWGIRLGLSIALLGSAEGAYMAARGAHTVGLADGGRGLPLINWSTAGGDLRVAHFLGLHGMQIVAAFGWWTRNGPAILVALFAGAYAALAGFLFWRAALGHPLI